MSASPKGSELDVSWTSPKKSPKPASLAANTHQASRNSGLHSDVGTFGHSARFTDKVIGHGASSPKGRDFYKRNPLYKSDAEKGLECTQGIGARPAVASKKMPKAVGPGSYEIVSSVAKKRSPLDGSEYCTMHIHQKLPSKLVPANLCSPGPHHKYEVRKPLDADRPSYSLPPMHHGERHHYPEDRDTPGPGSYSTSHHKSLASSASAPDLSSTEKPKLRTVKSTFGLSDRFKSTSLPSSSPNGAYYYSHYKHKDNEDYLSGARSCTFGKGGKTDFSNPHRGPRFQTSPVSYSPMTSMASKTSPLDGLTTRLASPIATYSKHLAASKKLGKEF